MKRPSLVFILLISFSVLASDASADISKWSLRYLARASNTLLVANDAALAGESIPCGIKKDEPQVLSLNLKKIIDPKIKSLLTLQKERIFHDLETCEKECTCDIYSLFLESETSSEAKTALEKINDKASKISSENRKSCAKSFPEFCKSELLKALR